MRRDTHLPYFTYRMRDRRLAVSLPAEHHSLTGPERIDPLSVFLIRRSIASTLSRTSMLIPLSILMLASQPPSVASPAFDAMWATFRRYLVPFASVTIMNWVTVPPA